MVALETEAGFHRKTAVDCFNETWKYIRKKRRTSDDDHMMLNLAHASRYHWGLVGGPTNLAVGDWQISRVYASLGQSVLALRFAKSSLQTCQKNQLKDILHTANEAMARAHAVAGDYAAARRYLSKAKTQLRRLKLDKEDRRIYIGQILETEKLLGK